MALIAPTRMTVNPSFTSHRFLLNNAVRSGFMRFFPDDGPDVKLTEGAKAVYVPALGTSAPSQRAARQARKGHSEAEGPFCHAPRPCLKCRLTTSHFTGHMFSPEGRTPRYRGGFWPGGFSMLSHTQIIVIWSTIRVLSPQDGPTEELQSRLLRMGV